MNLMDDLSKGKGMHEMVLEALLEAVREIERERAEHGHELHEQARDLAEHHKIELARVVDRHQAHIEGLDAKIKYYQGQISHNNATIQRRADGDRLVQELLQAAKAVSATDCDLRTKAGKVSMRRLCDAIEVSSEFISTVLK